MDYSPALFIAWIDPAIPWPEVVDWAKGQTWEHNCEHAVIELTDGKRALIRGGRLGIRFRVEVGKVSDPSGKALPSLSLEVDGEWFRISRLVMHMHPLVTGPSDWDLKVLELLGQDESLICEIGGELEGTRIRRRHE